MQPQFVHLRMHSEFSVTDSTVRLDSAIKAVKEQGVGALGLTDFNNIFGGLIFYTHARKAGLNRFWVVILSLKTKPIVINRFV